MEIEKEQIVYLKVKDLKNNSKNPRKNDDAVKSVAKSIEKYGFRNPLIVDENNIVWCGNTRLKASRELGLEEVPCIIVKDLTEQQMTELALLDNKTNEIADWDFEMLEDILEDCDLSDFPELIWGGVELDNGNQANKSEENPYTIKVDVPQYEIKGECPKLDELVNLEKTKELEVEINKSQIPQEQKDFLILASKRHLIFDYSKIAEYYAHQNKEVQELMEKSALVIIDFNDAMKNGYIKIKKITDELLNEDYGGEDDDE